MKGENDASNCDQSLGNGDDNDRYLKIFKKISIDKLMLPSKLFYFFFFSAWGSLLPYMALHFKQMLLTPSQVGILMGLKPFVNFVAIPLWGLLVDRYRMQRQVLLISMLALVASTVSIVFVAPPDDALALISQFCNKTHSTNDANLLLSHRTTIVGKSQYMEERYNFSHVPVSEIGVQDGFMSPGMIFLYRNSDGQQQDALKRTINSTSGVKFGKKLTSEDFYVNAETTFTEIFILLFFGTMIGSPSLALVDTATMRLLANEAHKYGRQRLSGSLGWGLAAFLIGASLRTTHQCIFDRHIELVDYAPCFYVFGVLMSSACVITIWLELEKQIATSSETSHSSGFEMIKDRISQFRFSCCSGGKTDTPKSAGNNEKDKGRDKNDSTPDSPVEVTIDPNISEVFEVLTTPLFFTFISTSLLLGIEMSFIKTFLFWHLKDMGANQLLFSVISAVNCVAEVTMYFFAEKLINFLGQKRILQLSLLCYSIRLVYYAFVPSPWWVLAVELLPGITTAAAWAACLSYVNSHSPPAYKTTMQCTLHSVHWGLGYGLGEVVGGLQVHRWGTRCSFLVNAVFCIVNLIIYIIVEHKFKEPKSAYVQHFYDNEPSKENLAGSASNMPKNGTKESIDSCCEGKIVDTNQLHDLEPREDIPSGIHDKNT